MVIYTSVSLYTAHPPAIPVPNVYCERGVPFQSNVTILSALFMLGGSVITDYVFTKNYYFMCGDNSTSSYDSRNWGLVPK